MSEKRLRLMRHGEYVSPVYHPPHQGPGSSQPLGGRQIKAYPKTERAHKKGLALGWIKAEYRDSIEYTSKTENLRGLAFTSGVLVGPAGAWMAGWFILAPLTFLGGPAWFSILMMLGAVFGVMMFALFVGLFVFLLRADFFHNEDMPTIFDRKHRKVFRLFREIPGGVFSVFKPWPTRVCAYDWDLVDACRESDVIASPAVPSVEYRLMFYVRKSANDSTVIDSFNIGSALELNEHLVDAMWEHIRSFMEEGGPHLPAPDEPLARRNPPTTWWQSLGATGFLGPGYWRRWVKQPSFMFLMHLIFPLTVPMFLLWGTGNWLSRKTEIKVQWPQQVLAAIGPRLK